MFHEYLFLKFSESDLNSRWTKDGAPVKEQCIPVRRAGPSAGMSTGSKHVRHGWVGPENPLFFHVQAE